MFFRSALIAVSLLASGCAGVVLPSVSDDLRKRAAVVELPVFMKEYAQSGFYLKQRLDPATQGWIAVPGAGMGVGLNLVAIDYGPHGYDYRQSDDVVRTGLWGALETWCRERSGRVVSQGLLPLGNREFSVHPGNGRICVGSDGRPLGAVVYGRVARERHWVAMNKSKTGSWRSLEYNIFGASELTEFKIATDAIRNEEKVARQQQANSKRQYEQALDENRRKMSSIQGAERQAAYSGWRRELKEGATCWVGPRKAGKPMMLHAMVIERKGAIVRVQYDGKTNAGYHIKLPSSEEWVKLTEVFPETEFDVLTGGGIFEPRVQPQ
jgi:hypothetical protein